MLPILLFNRVFMGQQKNKVDYIISGKGIKKDKMFCQAKKKKIFFCFYNEKVVLCPSQSK